jgi:hypothetical protein
VPGRLRRPRRNTDTSRAFRTCSSSGRARRGAFPPCANLCHKPTGGPVWGQLPPNPRSDFIGRYAPIPAVRRIGGVRRESTHGRPSAFACQNRSSYPTTDPEPLHAMGFSPPPVPSLFPFGDSALRAGIHHADATGATDYTGLREGTWERHKPSGRTFVHLSKDRRGQPATPTTAPMNSDDRTAQTTGPRAPCCNIVRQYGLPNLAHLMRTFLL